MLPPDGVKLALERLFALTRCRGRRVRSRPDLGLVAGGGEAEKMATDRQYSVAQKKVLSEN